MHLNEYNSYKIDYPEGGRQDRYPAAAAMLDDFYYFLMQPDLTMVHWAQFQDTAGGNWSGMISRAGHRKAVFNAYKLYQNMPVDRKRLSSSAADKVRGFASASNDEAAVLLWNGTDVATTVTVDMQHLPFRSAEMVLYRIDADHASWGDNRNTEQLAVGDRVQVQDGECKWVGAIPAKGVVYLNAKVSRKRPDRMTEDERAPLPNARVVRTFRYFPDRGSSSYSDFDERTWTVRTGSGRETSCTAIIAVLAENLPETFAPVLEVDGKTSGPKVQAAVRLDYQVKGNYSNSVVFPLTSRDVLSISSFGEMPWGTKRAADVMLTPNGGKIPLATQAPPGWTGRAIMTFIFNFESSGTRAKMRVKAGR
jgi:hypothetical protein